MSWFMLVFFGGYALINLCIIGWFWLMLRGYRSLQFLSLITFLGLSILFPMFFRSDGNEEWRITLLFIGALWLGTFTYIFFLIFFAELIGKFRKKPAGAARGFSSWSHSGKQRYVVCGCVLGLSVLIASVSYWMNANPVLNQYELNIEVEDPAVLNLPNDTLTVAVISDIHLGRLIPAKRLEKLLDLTKPHQPDAVFLVGDILDDHIRLDIPAMRKAIESMPARLGVWAAVGNHEYYSGDGDIDTSIKILQDSGINVLRDQWTVLDGKFLLVGRDDYSSARFNLEPRASLEEILKTVPQEQQNLPMIVLDHQPRNLEEAQNAGAKLQLSGHTHKGQLWPHSLALYFIYENAAGLYMKGDTQYLVSVGGGSWGPPMRNTARAEVLLLKLRFVKAKNTQ